MDTMLDQVNFQTSMKNIPLGGRREYVMQLSHSTAKVVKNMAWQALFILTAAQPERKETFGFCSQKKKPIIEEMKPFEADLVASVEWRENVSNELQQKLKNDCRQIDTDKNVIVAADKSNNFYRMSPKKYDEFMTNHITTDYTQADIADFDNVTREDKRIAEDLGIAERVPITSKREAFSSLKDHKDDFQNNPKGRILNPCKPELGKVSKQLLDPINVKLRKMTGLMQWKNSLSVIQWFSKLEDKQSYSFIEYDICDFYASISEQLLEDAFNWASDLIFIPERTKEIVFHVRKTFLFYKGQPYKKTNTPSFDVPMGAYDSAEVCDLVGLYLLTLIRHLPVVSGIYRDDALCLSNLSPSDTDDIKKQIQRIYSEQGLKIKINANKKVTNFLDLTLDLQTGQYKTFRKENNTPIYVHAQSNHPPSVKQNIPLAVNRRLNILSSDEQMFNQVVAPYQVALDNAGYSHKLKYEKLDIHKMNKKTQKKNKKQRKRRIFWFNPPYDMAVKTKIGKKFLDVSLLVMFYDHISTDIL